MIEDQVKGSGDLAQQRLAGTVTYLGLEAAPSQRSHNPAIREKERLGSSFLRRRSASSAQNGQSERFSLSRGLVDLVVERLHHQDRGMTHTA